MIYQYLKKPPVSHQQQWRHLAHARVLYRIKRILPTVMITVGASLLISVGYPIVSYELAISSRSKRPRFVAPVPQEVISESKGIISPAASNQPQVLAQTTVGTTVDYSKIYNWFDFSHPQASINPSYTTHYTLTIPKLRIKDAVVAIGGDDLSASLIHYGGTANPGEVGNTVIFGHSVLPQFYNPRSYRSIFSLIPTLDSGDEVIIKFDGIIYQYIVNDYYEVTPDEIDILEQRYDRKELTLVTCTPPGTYWRRGIIKAKLSG